MAQDQEQPEHHDFDTRRNGPFNVPPAVQDTTQRDEAAAENSLSDIHPSSAAARTPSIGWAGDPTSPDNAAHTTSTTLTTPAGRKSLQQDLRKSLQLARRGMQGPTRHASDPIPTSPSPPRTSTQMSRGAASRPSRDFDTRRDGPFGRPSLTMTRRRSSQVDMAGGQPRPTATTLGAGDEKTAQAAGPAAAAQPQASAGREREGVAPVLAPLESDDVCFEPTPPPLNYSLAPRKWSIVFFWSLIVVDCIFMPVGLYFGLWYGLTRRQLSANAVFSIVTAALGGVSIMEYVLRLRRLMRKGSTCRPIGARRAYLDWFHWNFSLGWFIIMIELIVGTVPAHPPIRLLAMPVPSMLYAFGTELVIVDILRIFHVPAPIRISSMPAGSQLRPCIYSIIEDVVAVDGSGGTAFREALNRRYEASHIFRAMLRRLGVVWAIGAQSAAIVLTILIFTIQDQAAYVVGWAVPFLWAGVWSAGTWWYVERMLRKEKAAWAEEVAMKAEEGRGSEREVVRSREGGRIEGDKLGDVGGDGKEGDHGTAGTLAPT